MFDKIKEDFFSVHGLITTFLHVVLVVGIVSSWVIVQVHVLGNDPIEVLQAQPSGKKR